MLNTAFFCLSVLYYRLFSKHTNQYWHILSLSLTFRLKRLTFYVHFYDFFPKKKFTVLFFGCAIQCNKNWWIVFHWFDRFHILIALRLLIFLYVPKRANCSWVRVLLYICVYALSLIYITHGVKKFCYGRGGFSGVDGGSGGNGASKAIPKTYRYWLTSRKLPHENVCTAHCVVCVGYLVVVACVHVCFLLRILFLLSFFHSYKIWLCFVFFFYHL